MCWLRHQKVDVNFKYFLVLNKFQISDSEVKVPI